MLKTGESLASDMDSVDSEGRGRRVVHDLEYNSMDHIPSVDSVNVKKKDSPNKSTNLPPLKVHENEMWQRISKHTDAHGQAAVGNTDEAAPLQLEECTQEMGPSMSPGVLTRPRATSMMSGIISAMTEQSDHLQNDDGQSVTSHQLEDVVTTPLDTNRLIRNESLERDDNIGSPARFSGMSSGRVVVTGMSSPSQYSLEDEDLCGTPTSVSDEKNDHASGANELQPKKFIVEYNEKQTDIIRGKDSELRKNSRALRHRARSGLLDVKEDDDAHVNADMGTIDDKTRLLREGSTVLMLADAAPLRGTTRKKLAYNPTSEAAPGASLAHFDMLNNGVAASSRGAKDEGEDEDEEDECDPGRLFPSQDWSIY